MIRLDLESDRSPFAVAAHELREYFLCPIPLGGDDGKKPLVKWRNQKNRPGVAYTDDLIRDHPHANAGILCRPSKVTVIDIDDPGVASEPQRLKEYKQRFGDTPLIIRTPSGGVHLYYRSTGERNANLRSHGLPVDVKGIGGMVVCPSSKRLGRLNMSRTGGSGSSFVDVKRLVADGTSGAFAWSVS